MNPTYDWIVIGAGITGSALSYELIKQGFTVLLLEKDPQLNNATLYSYGGLAYWSGTDDLTRQLSQEGIEIYRILSAQLNADIEFQEIDLLLTIDRNASPDEVAASYDKFAIAPQQLSIAEAVELEPLLNPDAISGALRLPHGHIHPHKTNLAYQQAFSQLGGQIVYEKVRGLGFKGDRIASVQTPQQTYVAERVVICGGYLGRSLLKSVGIAIPLYFTHSQVVKLPPCDYKLSTLVMSAQLQRLDLEVLASRPEQAAQWQSEQDSSDQFILDVGAVQFLDGSICLGQMSEILPNPQARFDLNLIEAQIRQGVAHFLPDLAQLPGTCHSCSVAFAHRSRPLVGEIIPNSGLFSFSGFTSTLLLAPPLARHFAQEATGQPDGIMAQLPAIALEPSHP